MPFPTQPTGYRTQFPERSDAPRYGVRAVGRGLAAVLAVPALLALALLGWGTWALLSPLF